MCEVSWFISSHLFLNLVRGLNYSFPSGLVFLWCSPLGCLSALLPLPLFYCCDVSVWLTLHWETEDKSAGFRCLVWNSCDVKEMHMFEAQLSHTHQFLKQLKKKKVFFFLFLLVNTNLPSKHCRVWVMDIWKNPKWVIWFAGVRMWMSCLTPDSSSNFSWNGWYLQISGKVSMYLLLMFVQLWSKIHHTLNFRRQNNWKSPKHQKHSSHYMYISILL